MQQGYLHRAMMMYILQRKRIRIDKHDKTFNKQERLCLG
jgi:hypothetical protein